jgi:AcrR family transcriptional regulator
MGAAAELIAELGWGRVTTRAVAERAELPHGSVSYHFRGKQELLAEAALHAFQQAIPVDQFAALRTVDDMIGLIAAEVGDPDAIDPVLSRLMLEAMREAEREPALRERMGAMLGSYRRLMIEAVRADQQRGAVFDGAPPEALATVIGAVGDGLLLHALLDPELDVAAAIEALRALLDARGIGSQPAS